MALGLFCLVVLVLLLATAIAQDPNQVTVLTTDPAQTITITRLAIVPDAMAVIEAAAHCPNCESWVGGQLTIPPSAMTDRKSVV